MQAGNCNSARHSRALFLFPACIMSAINSKYYSNPYCYNIVSFFSTLVEEVCQAVRTVLDVNCVNQMHTVYLRYVHIFHGYSPI